MEDSSARLFHLNSVTPHQVAVTVYKKKLWSGKWVFGDCGGSIINKYWVLSAAHCFHKHTEKKITVEAGLGNLRWHGLTIRDRIYQTSEVVKPLMMHPNWTGWPSTRYDFALLKVRLTIILGSQIVVFYSGIRIELTE